MILSCVCTAASSPAAKAQDELYGKGMRVHNPRLNNKAPRCTVCGRENKSAGNVTPEKKAPKK